MDPVYRPVRSLVMPGVVRSVVMQPPVFELWYRARAWRFLATHGMASLEGHADDVPKNFRERVATYNQSQLWTFHRTRTEKLMAVMRCIDGLPKAPKILCIGPRNEAELLLLHLYGFPLENITSIDLFSYSPKIQLMDMHALDFPDSSFDIVYSAWTLKYSYDLDKACAEIVRVAKPGGLVAIGFSHTTMVTDVVGAPIAGGLDELHRRFEPNIAWHYWQEAGPVHDGAQTVTTIFRVKKDGSEARAAS